MYLLALKPVIIFYLYNQTDFEMQNKVKFKKISSNQIKALLLITEEYIKNVSLQKSTFYDIAIGSLLYELENKLVRYAYHKSDKHSFSLSIYQATALYIALDKNEKYTDFFSFYVVRKFQNIIQKDFINRM